MKKYILNGDHKKLINYRCHGKAFELAMLSNASVHAKKATLHKTDLKIWKIEKFNLHLLL